MADDKEMRSFLEEWESQQKMGDRLDIETDKLYRVEIVRTSDGTSDETGADYTMYRLSDSSPMAPNGVFFLSGIARKTMNEHLQFSWKNPSEPIKLKFVRQQVKKPGKQPYFVIKPMTVDSF